MYHVAAGLDPDSYYALARATFGEMLMAGITTVGEFHYLHHQADGTPYSNPNEMSHSIIRAAGEAGIRLTLLDTVYLQGGVHGEPLEGAQRRFSDGTADRWIERVSELVTPPGVLVGAAVHSVRAVNPESIARVAEWTESRGVPLHAHVAEQPAEVMASMEVLGAAPVEILAEAGAVGERFTAVHATHLDQRSIDLLGSSRSSVCMCPTTERYLAAGIGPSVRLSDAGAELCFGTDSHAVIDPFEEMQALEMNERLVTLERGHHPARSLLESATAGGHASLGWAGYGRIAAGGPADLVAHPRFGATGRGKTGSDGGHDRRLGHGRRREVRNGGWSMGGSRRAPYEIRRRRLLDRGAPGSARMITTAIDNIGLLVTNDPDTGEGLLGLRRGVALVFADDRVIGIEPAGVSADTRLDAAGRCVIPGFVDSHTHMVFAGDRGDEFVARMAGEPYDVAGIARTRQATRAAATRTCTSEPPG